MNATEYLRKRREAWNRLDELCRQLQYGIKHVPGRQLTQFAQLYRATCADLALADAYQLPEATVRYLHQLVARAHNLLYRSRSFRFREWMRELLFRVPRRLFSDPYLRVAALVFYGLFVLCYLVGWTRPRVAENVLGHQMIQALEMMYDTPPRGSLFEASTMAGFYIQHNTSIGFQCFAMGLVLGVGGLFTVAMNAVLLGLAFGYMNTTPLAANFNEFVTAHAPLELTAIVVSAAAGMRLGFALLLTGGKTRLASLQQAGREALPVVMLAAVLFVLAALVEGYVSRAAIPYAAKAAVAIGSALMLGFYLVVIGAPGSRTPPAGPAGEPTWEQILARS